MPIEIVLLTLLHILVLVYWLGGDIGAFYASYLVTDESLNTDTRMAAAKTVSDIDLSPKTSLIFAAPTGLLLAQTKGWIDVPHSLIAIFFLVAIVWVFAVWKNHFSTPKNSRLAKIDMSIRYLTIAALTATAIAIFSGYIQAPLFLGLKMLLLTGAIVIGLFVRNTLRNFAEAIPSLASGNPSPDDNCAIRVGLSRTRPLVILIWILILSAALLGVAKPI